jgi:hypothetical protein
MAKFITGDELNSELSKLIETAEQELYLISPFIKLHERIKEKLRLLAKDPIVEIIIVYGKKRNNLEGADLQFLTNLPNIEIRYEARLHAKYYANEVDGLLTSMNLVEFSHNNNIEFGVLTKSSSLSFWNRISADNEVDDAAFNYFLDVVADSELCFKRTPKFKNEFADDPDDYTHSETLVDTFTGSQTTSSFFDVRKQKAPGYCIRTGKQIQFNPQKPFTYEAFKDWARYKNRDYCEKFCHFSGELSSGETSFSFPIMKKNYKKAKEIFGF